MDKNIGALLKQNRKQRGITLQQLAEKSGLSVSYLSMLERGMSSPTVANLSRLCQALDITMSGLLMRLDQDRMFVKKENRRQVYESDGGILYESITEGNRAMRGVCMHVRDNDRHISEKHVSDEVGYVIQGTLTILMNGNEYELHQGDTLYIPANTPHTYYKTCQEESISIWFYHNISALDDKFFPMSHK